MHANAHPRFAVFLLLWLVTAIVHARSPQFGGSEFYERMQKLAGSQVPGTFRDVPSFQAIPAGTSIPELLRRVGIPDIDVGSGLHIYEYLIIPDGRIRVATRDDKSILYIDYVQDGVASPKRLFPHHR